jgi:hypothetical protein
MCQHDQEPSEIEDCAFQVAMKSDEGIRKLLIQGRKKFRVAENLKYYSKEDFKAAEKLFLKACILDGRCSLGGDRTD